jgi:hypothetical protein
MNESPLDRRLRELARLTDSIRARPGFDARVLAAVAAEVPLGLGVEIVRSARLFLPLALAVAVLSLGWALRSEGSVDSDLAAAEQPLELEW